MAEVTAFRNNALPYPIYGAPFVLDLVILDADGDPITGATGLDSEVSKNGDTPADCTNEATEIGSSAKYYLSLTGAELTCDCLSGVTKTSTSGGKTTPWSLYPRKLVTLRSGTSASGGSDTDGIVLDSGASDQDDFYNGMVVIATIDSVVEVRVISDYVGSTKKATVVPDFNTAPDNNDTFVIKLPEGRQVHQVNVTHVAGTPQTAGDIPAMITAVDDFVDTEVAAIKAKTDNLPSDPADASDIAAAFSTVNTKLDTIDDFLDTEVAAIKAKTDNLPSDPADQSAVEAAITAATSPLATAAALTVVDDFLDTEIAAIKAKTDNLPSDPADQSAVEAAITAATSPLATAAALATVDDFLDTEIAAIKAKTDNLPSDPADQSAVEAAITAATSSLATAAALTVVDDFLDTEIAAIKAKTDNLPSDPADQSAVEAAITAATSPLATAAALATVDDFLDTEMAATLAAVLSLIAAGYTRTNTAQAGAAGAITLDAGASAVDDFYNNQIIVIASGTGAGQARFVSDYVGATKVASVATWVTNPDNTSVFYLIPFGAIPGATAPTAVEVRQEMDNNSTKLASIDAKTTNLPSDPADASVVAGLIAAVSAKVDTIDDFLDTEVAAIKAKTDNLPSDPADQSAVEAAITAATSPLATAAALATVDDFLDTEIAAIKAKTDNLPSDPADQSAVEAAITAATSPLATAAALTVVDDFLDTEVAAIKAKTDNLPSDPADQSLLIAATNAIVSAIAALNNLSAAEVKTQMVAALSGDTYAEPVLVPAAASSLAAKVGLLFALARNISDLDKDTGVMRLRNDADSGNIGTRTDTDDGTVYRKGELG